MELEWRARLMLAGDVGGSKLISMWRSACKLGGAQLSRRQREREKGSGKRENVEIRTEQLRRHKLEQRRM